MSANNFFIPEPIFALATDLAGVWIRGTKQSKLVLAAAITFGALAAALFFWGFDRPAQFLAATGAVLAVGVLAYQRAFDRSLRAERIVEFEKEAEAHPDKAKPAWDLASAKLESYVDRNLSQVAWIFVLVLIVMTAGFVVIGLGIYKVFTEDALKPSIVATTSGIVIEFIAATFLLIYRSTMEQAKDYVGMLERINAVGMSAQLLEAIEDTDPKIKDAARARLSDSLLEMYRQPKPKAARKK